MRSLAQFQALQDGEKELASLRELGLTDAEIQLWRNRDVQDKTSGGKVRVWLRDKQSELLDLSGKFYTLRRSLLCEC